MKEQFNEIIKSQDLREITMDLVEKVLDNEITNDGLKEVPILKYLVAAKRIYSSYTDRIFIKKAMHVLLELEDVNWTQRMELTAELDDEDGSGAEKILMSIDRLESIEKCKVYGRLCKLRALEKIDKPDFKRLTKLIQDAYLDDLILVTNFKKDEGKEIWEGDYYAIIALGLLFQEPSEQKPIERNDERFGSEFIGGEIKFNYLLSSIGNVLLEHYYELFPKDKK